MNEIDWLNELYTVCSAPNIDILRFLWSQDKSIDTYSISKGTHMSMEEVYEHLQSLEVQGLVKVKRIKTKNGIKRFWNTTLNEFAILIKAEKGDFTYQSNINQKSLEIEDIPTKTSKKKISGIQEISTLPTAKIKMKHKQHGDIEFEGSESFIEKRWNELKPLLKQSPIHTKKHSSTKKPSKTKKEKSKTKSSK